jgi:hypothetical protein
VNTGPARNKPALRLLGADAKPNGVGWVRRQIIDRWAFGTVTRVASVDTVPVTGFLYPRERTANISVVCETEYVPSPGYVSARVDITATRLSKATTDPPRASSAVHNRFSNALLRQRPAKGSLTDK